MVAIRNIIMLPILVSANSALGDNLTTSTTTLLHSTPDKNASTAKRFPLRMTLAANAVAVLEEHNLYDLPRPPSTALNRPLPAPFSFSTCAPRST